MADTAAIARSSTAGGPSVIAEGSSAIAEGSSTMAEGSSAIAEDSADARLQRMRSSRLSLLESLAPERAIGEADVMERAVGEADGMERAVGEADGMERAVSEADWMERADAASLSPCSTVGPTDLPSEAGSQLRKPSAAADACDADMADGREACAEPSEQADGSACYETQLYVCPAPLSPLREAVDGGGGGPT